MKTKTKTIVSNIISTVCPALASVALFLSSIQPASAQTWSGAGNPGNDNWNNAANWSVAPSAYSSLIFATSVTGTDLNNNNNLGFDIDGITFDNSGSSQYTLAGSSLTLSGQAYVSYTAVVNNSTVAQTLSLPLSLDWGYYTFSSTPGGTLAIDGGLTLGTVGSVAYFDANNTTAASPTALTTDASGLISGLDGSGMIYSTSTGAPVAATATTSCLATVVSGAITTMGYDTTLSGGGNSNPNTSVGNNVVITDSGVTTSYNFLNQTIGTLTCLNAGSAGSFQCNLNVYNEVSPGFYLSFGNPTYGASVFNGGLYVPNAASGAFNVVQLYGGNGGSITAGWPTAGAGVINFMVNGSGTANQQLYLEPQISIIDNPAGGAVTLVKSGTGTVQINSGTPNGGAVNNSYTGGTYVNQGYLKAQAQSVSGNSALGSGPVYIASGASVFLTAGTWNNAFYLSPGLFAQSYKIIPSQGSLLWSSTSTASGTITLLGAPTSTVNAGDKISDNTSGSTFTFTGQITGTGTLELGGVNGNHNCTYILNNTGTANNWTGGLIMDVNSGGSGCTTYVECFAANQMGTPAGLQAGGPYAGNVLIVPDPTGTSQGGTRFDIHGNATYIGGLSSGGTAAGSARIFDSIATPATLYIGANNASGTFAGISSDGGSGDALSINKIGTGTQTFSLQLGHHGTTTCSAGELVIDTTSANVNGTGNFVTGGTLDIASTSTSIVGNTTVSGGTLELDNNTALASTSTLTITAPGAVYLNYSGTQTVSALYFVNNQSIQAEAGTWGAVGSSAAHQSGSFSGTGILNVTSGPATPATLYYNTQGVANNPANWSPASADWNDLLAGTDPNQNWIDGCYAYFGASDITSVPEDLVVPATGIDTPGITVASASSDFGLTQPQGTGAVITLDSDPANPGYCTVNLQGRNLYLTTLLQGSAGLYIEGTPLNGVQCVMSSTVAATYTGNTYIGEEVTAENTQCFGPSGTIMLAGGLLKASNSAGNAYFSFPNPVQIVGNNTVCPFGSANNWMRFAGNVNISGTGDQLWVGNIEVTLSGVISGNDLNVYNYVNGSSSQNCIMILNGGSPNTYSGGTTVNFQNGPAPSGHTTLLDAQTAGSLGTGNVSVGAPLSGGGCTLQLDSGAEMASTATLSVVTGSTVNMTYAGTEYINALWLNGVQQPAGVYGVSAPNGSLGGILTGSGTLTVGSGPPIPITSETIVSGQLNICWTSVTGGQYNVYTTTTLEAPEPWTLVSGSPVTGAAGTTTCFTLPGLVSGNPQIFVRVMQ
jgi:hypothetical protein